MAKLVALVDGSIYARSVCDHAAWAAGRMGTAVEVLHVLGRRETASAPADLSGSIGAGARERLLEELAALDEQRAGLSRQRGRAIVDTARAQLAAAGVADVTARLRFGDLVEAVREAEPDASLIVLGKRGEAADFARGHLGSNLERIVRGSTRPILIASRAMQPVTTILVAFDGGMSSIKAAAFIGSSGLGRGLRCLLFTAGNPSEQTTALGEAAVADLQRHGVEARYWSEAGAAETAIASIADREGVSMIAMGAYGHSRIRALVIGSTTTELIRTCRIPILVIR